METLPKDVESLEKVFISTLSASSKLLSRYILNGNMSATCLRHTFVLIEHVTQLSQSYSTKYDAIRIHMLCHLKLRGTILCSNGRDVLRNGSVSIKTQESHKLRCRVSALTQSFLVLWKLDFMHARWPRFTSLVMGELHQIIAASIIGLQGRKYAP